MSGNGTRRRALAACTFAALACALALGAGTVRAWSRHAIATAPALAGVAAVAQAAPVKVEPIEDFLSAQGERLAQVLDQQEAWARAHLPSYAPRPEALRFTAAGATDAAELRRRFVAAVRIAPDVRLALFVQPAPGAAAAPSRPGLAPRDVTTLERDSTSAGTLFAALRAGETVAPLDVLASASDEPDYGLDIGLFEDNGTAHGRAYGFGKQPFGNPALDFGSQAPFHMGFHHEAWIVYKAAGFLKRTQPEYRIHLWATLARHALRSGHDYWGWRFAGWALHYLQDLAQPYHARVLPGVGTARMLWINTLHLAGLPGARDRAVTLVSNRHLAFENFARTALLAAYRGERDAALLLDALAGRGAWGDERAAAGPVPDPVPGAGAPWDDAAPRERVSRSAAAAAAALDRVIAASLPARYVDDPGFEFGNAGPGIDLYALLAREAPARRDAMLAALAPRLAEYGAHTRAFVRALLEARDARGASEGPASGR